jgi:hypothetical protein
MSESLSFSLNAVSIRNKFVELNNFNDFPQPDFPLCSHLTSCGLGSFSGQIGKFQPPHIKPRPLGESASSIRAIVMSLPFGGWKADFENAIFDFGDCVVADAQVVVSGGNRIISTRLKDPRIA